MPKTTGLIMNNVYERIIFFDGFCNLCNSSIDYVVKNDKKAIFKIASLQGKTASKLIPSLIDKTDSIVFLRDDKVYCYSTAILYILIDLKSWRGLFGYLGFIMPRFIRDKLYRFIAANRYKWFGKKESCRMPTINEKMRFLE